MGREKNVPNKPSQSKNAGNQSKNAGNQSKNAGNQSKNAGNQSKNTGNQSKNAGNQSKNTGEEKNTENYVSSGDKSNQTKQEQSEEPKDNCNQCPYNHAHTTEAKKSIKLFNILSTILSGVLIGVLSAAIIGGVQLYNKVCRVEEEIGHINEKVSSSETRLRREIAQSENHIKDYITFLQDYVLSINNSSNQTSSKPLPTGYVPVGNLETMLFRSYMNVDSPIAEYDTLISHDSIVIESISDGRPLNLSEVAERKLILPYLDGDDESLFYGQLSQDGNWDGNCIINTYKEDNLVLITDAQYADGVLVSCKQVFPYQTEKEGDVWAISNRTKFDGFSTGDTIYVKRYGNHTKNFLLSDASVDDVLTVETFAQSVLSSSYLVGFYHGNIANGLFNDTTGDAYLVKFFEDETIRMLYKGPIKNGDIADSRDKGAWLIGRDNKDAVYSYYTGPFIGRGTTNNQDYWEEMSYERVQQILDENLVFNKYVLHGFEIFYNINLA